MWKANLTDAQRAVVMGAGILPFLDSQLTIGDNCMQITEEHIREATGLPIAGISVSPWSGVTVHEANSDALLPDLHAVFSNPHLTVHHEIDDRRAESTAAFVGDRIHEWQDTRSHNNGPLSIS